MISEEAGKRGCVPRVPGISKVECEGSPLGSREKCTGPKCSWLLLFFFSDLESVLIPVYHTKDARISN